MRDLTAAQKGTFAYRVVAGVLLAVATYLGGKVLGYSESSEQTINSINKAIKGIDQDVSFIKWELPLIKETMATNKKSVEAQIENEKASLRQQIIDLQKRIDIAFSEDDQMGKEISGLRHELEMLKQKLSVK